MRIAVPGPSGTQRAATLAGVLALHVVLLLVLASTGALPPLLPAVSPARLILPPPRRLLPEPPRVRPVLEAAPDFVPEPQIRLAPPVQQAAPRVVARAAPALRGGGGGHFGAASDSGLGLDVAASSGGGSAARGTLAGFEAAVRARVLAARRQPKLAWDRRQTCVVNYRVMVGSSGALAGFSIDPCAVPEINQAAREAIGGAGPFPPPPALGAATTEVHGSMIFHP